jgi:predicted flap endonuclease-1-like 5' DNA nuclease
MSSRDYNLMKEISALAEFKGMGVVYAHVLWERGIVTVAQIAAQDPEQLTMAIRRRTGWTNEPTEERVKVWIAEARRQVRRGRTQF